MNTLKIGISMLFVGTLLLVSCGTTPVPNERQTPSYSSNAETSGILGFLGDGSLEVDALTRAKYNSYIERQGANLLPPITQDYGLKTLANGNFSMSLEAFEKWKELQLKEERERINNAK